MKTVKQLIYTIFPIIIIGLAFVVPSYVQQVRASSINTSSQPAISVPKTTVQSNTPEGVISGKPVQISVPSLGLNIPVEDGAYDQSSATWTISENAAYYALPTDLINSSNGNTLIYGHNSKKIFGTLSNMQLGAKVVVETDTGYVFTYSYSSTETVAPTQVEVLQYSGKPRLMLQTCTGFWNEKRQMFYFELDGYKKI